MRTLSGPILESVFIWPLIFLVGFFMLVPILESVVHSFYNWNPGYSSVFTGLTNYSDLFGSPVLRQVAVNELVLVIGVPLWAGVPLLIALMLYDRVPGAGVFRTIFFFPAVLSPAVIGIVFSTLLRPDGILNGALRQLGVGFLAHNWIDSATLVKPSLIFIIAWFSLGFGVLIYGAALSAVPPELFEAAEVDGATWFQQLRYVMFPAIKPMVFLNIVLNFGNVFLLFGYIFVLTQGGPGHSSTTIDWDIYQKATLFGQFGLAAAESVLVLVTVVLVIVGGLRLGKRFAQ
jgi:ABC-type sugar transport system permease subunit